MKENQIVAQLYTVRDYLKTPEDIAASMKKLSKIGYKSVQLCGLGPLSEAEYTKILDGEGLTCVSTHDDSEEIVNAPEKVLERMDKLNCIYTAYPFPKGISMDSLRSIKNFAKSLEKSGKVLAEGGKFLGYHNHSNEFYKIKDKTVLDIIYEETDPRYLVSELDTYWVQHGGGDVVSWIQKMKKRLPFIHLKDYGITLDRQPLMKEIGEGNMEWGRIIKAAAASGCKWFIVEQDNNWVDNDPFKSLKISFQYLKKNFCS
jgi:sugar phosphate isomerase/epimerase